MPRYKAVIHVKDVPFNGTVIGQDIEVIVPAPSLVAAQEKAQRSAEYYARYAGKKVATPKFTVTEVSE